MNKKNIVVIIAFVFIFNINVYSNDTKPKQEYFKIKKDNSQIINVENIEILDINNNKIGNKNWSSAVVLNNGNLLVGEYKPNKTYDYYEVNKQGEKSFITNNKYYIKDIHSQTGSFITVKEENQKYYLGVLDKEFNIVYDNIFEYKENSFKEYSDILKTKDGTYGVFTIEGEELISPIFNSIKKIDNNSFEVIYKDKNYILKKSNNSYVNETAINNIDNWARNSVRNAINLNFISQNLQVKLNEYITRAEFCEIMIKLYEKKTGFEISTNVKNNFVDTNNKYVTKAYSLGIISGKTANRFEPNSYITREESAVILANLIKKMEYPIKDVDYQYLDSNLISPWAKESIQIVSNSKIMTGDTKNKFNPKNNYKVVEAISTIMRLYELK
ncbi:S-layer homology domain-containing protein [uncultured Tyzzerella sp.]|uniref:S-layer homology domain-containing protein n=1 Tax=uncultured Tyzzerella sp. TaxID=2321398 RepID=UPI0029432768|nr:S-layer homology domain-containing protein [uncultured Tyzzerella sp.]